MKRLPLSVLLLASAAELAACDGTSVTTDAAVDTDGASLVADGGVEADAQAPSDAAAAADGGGEVEVDGGSEVDGGEGPALDAAVDPDAYVPGAVVLETPTEGAYVTSLPLAVRAHLAPEGVVGALRLALDGSELATATDAASIEHAVETLASGPHTIEATGVDAAGTTSTAAASFVYDAAAPTVTLTTPREGASLLSRRILVEGRVTDDVEVASLALVFDGTTENVVVEADGSFATEVLASSPDVELELVATDGAGRSTTVARSAYFGSRVSGGGAHSGAIVRDVFSTWGRNNLGQVGNGATSTTGVTSPFVQSLASVASFSARQLFSIALLRDGTLYGFGQNADGQLGVGDLTSRSSPTLVSAITDAVAVATGYNHTLVLREDGTVLAFGDDTSGQLGDGTSGTDAATPVEVLGLSDVVQVAAGSQHSLALTRDGRVYAWGRNQYGNLGNGTSDTSVHAVPTLVEGLVDVVELASGRDHILALHADGTVSAWGLNATGQVGNGDDEGENVLAPTPVLRLADDGSLVPLDGVAAVRADGNMSYVILRSGLALGWGQNGNGQLGLGDTENRTSASTPILVLENVVDLEPGATHVHALVGTSEGLALYGWGWSFQGSLGEPTAMTNWAYPSPIAIALP